MKLRIPGSRRRCPLCHDHLNVGGEVRPCAGCGTEYHFACLGELGGCATLGCARRGAETHDFHRTLPRDEDTPLAELCAHPAVSAISAQALKIDPTTFLESLWFGGGILALFGAVGTLLGAVGGDLPWSVPLIGTGLTVLFGWLYARTDNYYVIDFERRDVRYNRAFLERRSLRTVARFDDLAGFAVNAKQESSKNRGTWWEYFVIMILRDGTTIRLTDGEEGGRFRANTLVNELANRTGSRAWLGKHQQRLRVHVDPLEGVQVTYSRSNRAALLVGFAIILALIVGMALLVAAK